MKFSSIPINNSFCLSFFFVVHIFIDFILVTLWPRPAKYKWFMDVWL